MQVMLERIAALKAMLQQAPIVSGRFTAAPFLYLARPVHKDMSAAVAAAAQLGRCANITLAYPIFPNPYEQIRVWFVGFHGIPLFTIFVKPCASCNPCLPKPRNILTRALFCRL